MATSKIKSKTKIKIEIIALEIILIGAAIAILFVSKVENYTFEKDATYFSNSLDFEVPAGSKAQYDEDKECIVIKVDKETVYEADGEPVYFDSDSFISIDDYIYFDVHSNDYDGYKMSYFTEFNKVDAGVYATREEGSSALEGGFLFDGKDTYVMLEDATLQYNGNSVNMPAMSYARVCKGNWIIFYDADKNYTTLEYLDSQYSVTIHNRNNTYVISAESDLLTMNQKDEKVMLFSNPDLYSLYDFGG